MNRLLRWSSAALLCAVVAQAQGQELITNGCFESGFAGGTRDVQLGWEGPWFGKPATASPVNAFAVPPPPGGSNAAMTDAQGPGSHVLYRDFVVPMTLSVAQLRFDLYI